MEVFYLIYGWNHQAFLSDLLLRLLALEGEVKVAIHGLEERDVAALVRQDWGQLFISQLLVRRSGNFLLLHLLQNVGGLGVSIYL